MERFTDEYGHKYCFNMVTHYGGKVVVHCPKCSKNAYISIESNEYVLRCGACYYTETQMEAYKYSARGVCQHCERYFNLEVKDEKQMTQKQLNIACPHCQTTNQVPMHRVADYRWRYQDIRDGRDPIFHLELYYLDYFRGKPVWAVNREHLSYLISYTSATLREKPANGPMRTASHSLPVYMKEAKNRDAIVKILHKLQKKFED
ncbi:hypothetical protein ABE137_01970 [Brevibacillus laterosporus]|uniref:Replication restart DNA helicase PriA n=1 Tax=Brevibacillus halotolerans TaxID=1507437 RepID=A0ABT4I0E0_9BACL|nr:MULTISPECIES: hypothetical protein [Brevibacillus]MCR8986791.1 hypothetical protein [Brevibacillus laterosporus]MCZ0832527.1 hypothetical protein [Brevibacillus halotolerans]